MDSMPAKASQKVETVPPFVLEYAPIVWLNSKEEYLPSDIGSQLIHTKPKFQGNIINSHPTPLTLDNLDSLNAEGGKDVYLSSIDDVSKDPAWIKGVKPDASGKTNGAVSCCIVVNDHGNGYVDAFYLYFYAYNQGQVIFGKELGDHLGDWEHNMIRFKNGSPTAMWFSQHASGEAITWSVLQKQPSTPHPRPVSFSAKGTHANYASSGTHDHAIPNFNLPLGVLEDRCDHGTMWDPTLSAYIYKYAPGKTPNTGTFTAYDPSHPTAWLNFQGHWGDDKFPSSDPRQHGKNIGSHLKYEGGPTGPYDKQLERKNIWPSGAWGSHIWVLLPWA